MLSPSTLSTDFWGSCKRWQLAYNHPNWQYIQLIYQIYIYIYTDIYIYILPARDSRGVLLNPEPTYYQNHQKNPMTLTQKSRGCGRHLPETLQGSRLGIHIGNHRDPRRLQVNTSKRDPAILGVGLGWKRRELGKWKWKKKLAAKKFLDTFFADWKNLWVITNAVQDENNLKKSIASIKTYDTSSAAQGGRGSVKNRKPIGKVGCCESQMAEQRHWWIDRWLRYSLSFSFLLFPWLSTYLRIYLSIELSIYPNLI